MSSERDPIMDLRDYVATGLAELCGEAEEIGRGFDFTSGGADVGVEFRGRMYSIKISDDGPA